MDKHLSKKPHYIHCDGSSWYYEEPGGLEFFVQSRDMHGKIVSSKVFLISWKMIKAAIRRKERRDGENGRNKSK